MIYLFDFQGRMFHGDLLGDGKIIWQENGQAFNSPSAWATHCKRLVNPAKKSGCGWASVRYKGQKLDQYKTAWLRQNQIHVSVTEGVSMIWWWWWGVILYFLINCMLYYSYLIHASCRSH